MSNQCVRPTPSPSRGIEALTLDSCDLSDLDRLIMGDQVKRDGAFRASADNAQLDEMDCTLLLQGLPSPPVLTRPQMLTILEESRHCVGKFRKALATGEIPSTWSAAELVNWATEHNCHHFLPPAFIEAIDPMALDAARTRSQCAHKRVAATKLLQRAKLYEEKQAWWASVRQLMHLEGMPVAETIRTLLNDCERSLCKATIRRRIQQFQSNEQRRTVWTRGPGKGRGRPSAKGAHDALYACALEVMRKPGFRLGRVDDFVRAVLDHEFAPLMSAPNAKRVLYKRGALAEKAVRPARTAESYLGWKNPFKPAGR